VSDAHAPEGIAFGCNQPPAAIDLFGVKEAGFLSPDVGESTVAVELFGLRWKADEAAQQAANGYQY
jgi:hypothetical protein